MMFKVLLYTSVTTLALTWVGLQTPYVEPASRIIKATNSPSDCLKIKEFREGDKVYRNVRRLNFKQRFYTVEVNGRTASLSTRSTNKGDHPDIVREREIARSKCKFEDYSDNLLKLAKGQAKSCSMDNSENGQDRFIPKEFNNAYQILCGYKRWNMPEKGYIANCSYSGVYKGWSISLGIPSDDLINWKDYEEATHKRFDESFEILNSCPIIVPFI